MPDSAPRTIPMTYAMQCETLRFAGRNDGVVLPGFRPRRGARLAAARAFLPCREAAGEGGPRNRASGRTPRTGYGVVAGLRLGTDSSFAVAELRKGAAK